MLYFELFHGLVRYWEEIGRASLHNCPVLKCLSLVQIGAHIATWGAQDIHGALQMPHGNKMVLGPKVLQVRLKLNSFRYADLHPPQNPSNASMYTSA
jgi:hypothetical protein